VRQRTIGDASVSELGLGCVHLSLENRPDERQAIATIHAALDAGVTFLDTADAYSLTIDDFGHNERLVAAALATADVDTGLVLVATKGGHTRPNGTDWGVDGTPQHLRAACEASLRRLGTDSIGLYQLHWPDPQVPYEETMGGLLSLVTDGLAQRIGICNASLDQIRIARAVLGRHLVSVQNEFSLWQRDSFEQLRLCEELGLAFVPYKPLGGIRPSPGVDREAPVIRAIADGHGASNFQVALAWLLALSPVVIPIPGSRRPSTILDSVEASELQLHADEIEALNDGYDGLTNAGSEA
jgi:aryl-alcohol dehydrogenase-like predicted oxidoreductase